MRLADVDVALANSLVRGQQHELLYSSLRYEHAIERVPVVTRQLRIVGQPPEQHVGVEQ